MQVCLPTTSDDGLQGRLSPHFGSAPFFTFVNTATGQLHVEANNHARHEPGHCTPTKGLEGRSLEAVICRGLGQRALRALLRAEIPVLVTEAWTVAEALDGLKNGALRPLSNEEACTGGHSHSHSHHS